MTISEAEIPRWQRAHLCTENLLKETEKWASTRKVKAHLVPVPPTFPAGHGRSAGSCPRRVAPSPAPGQPLRTLPRLASVFPLVGNTTGEPALGSRGERLVPSARLTCSLRTFPKVLPLPVRLKKGGRGGGISLRSPGILVKTRRAAGS